MWIEEPYLFAAKDLGIPTIGCIQSFDNLTTRSSIPFCDNYAVWNQRMRDQLLRFYPDRNPSRVYITGTPQFDFHVRHEYRWSRDITLERLGLHNTDRYILYAANLHYLNPTEPELVEELAHRCAQTPELRTHRIVIRLHPQDNYSRWDRLVGRDPRIVISRPSKRSFNFPSPESQKLLISTLLHADVCANWWSTISLDAATVDTPVVCVAFGGSQDRLTTRFCAEVYDTEFYRPVIESGGVRLAVNMDQLVAELVTYLRDRSRDRAERRRLVAEECGQVDGRAAERIANLIASIINEPTATKGI